MKICYIMMQYPLPTQTFAISDILALEAQGNEVEVECLLPPRRRQKSLMATYGLHQASIHNARLSGYLLGAALGVRYIPQNWSLFYSAFRAMAFRPFRVITFAVLLPRIFFLVWKLSKNPPDVVHAFWGHWPSMIPALLTRYAPSVCTSVHMGAYDLYAGFPLCLTADAVTCRFTHSSVNIPQIRELGVCGNVHMVHRGIPVSDLSAEDEDGLPIEKVPLRFCSASALSKVKKVDTVLRVFAIIKKSCPNATLVIAGDGEERQRLELLCKELDINDSVTFLGYVKRHSLFKVMSSSEFFLFFSTKVSERLPNVVKEAMLAECVCVVSKTQGIEELIPGPDYGFTVTTTDPVSIASCVQGFIEETLQNSRVGKNAHERIVDHFSSEAAMSKYTSIWTREVQNIRSVEP